MITIAYEAIKDTRSRVKTTIFGTSGLADCEDILKASTLSLAIKKRNPALQEIIVAEQATQNR